MFQQSHCGTRVTFRFGFKLKTARRQLIFDPTPTTSDSLAPNMPDTNFNPDERMYCLSR